MTEQSPSDGGIRPRQAAESHRAAPAAGGPDGPDAASVFDPESSVLTRGWRHGDDDDDVHPRESNAVVATLRFVYRHSTALVPAGVLWVLLSLPLVTVGPASVGLYATIQSLRDTGRVDRQDVVETVRVTLRPAMLLGFLPVVFLCIGALYALSGFTDGLVGMALTAAVLYAGIYIGVLLIPTFVLLAAGAPPKRALRAAYLWIAGDPAAGLKLLLVTVAVFLATLGLTIGFALLFGAIAGTYHTEVVSRAMADETTPLGQAATPPA